MRRAVASLSPLTNVRDVTLDVRETFGRRESVGGSRDGSRRGSSIGGGGGGGGGGNDRVIETFSFDKNAREWRNLDPVV